MSDPAAPRPSVLSEEMLRVIRGEVPPEEKREQYRDSLHSWWAEYSHRKNDEDDMVADSLLYDERCHLPRTAPGPRFEEVATTDGATGSAPQQGQEAVQAGVSGVQHTAGAEVHGQNATS